MTLRTESRWLLASALAMAWGCSGGASGTDASNSAPDTSVGADVGAAADIADLRDSEGAQDADGSPDVGPPTNVAFDEAIFAATHNSYSGGARGSILAQLNSGVRFIEFDVHADDFATSGFQIGHDMPGHEVELGGDNPDTLLLTDWFEVVTTWAAATPDHLPLTIGVDLKDDFATMGIVTDFEEMVTTAFGDALFASSEVGTSWPTVDAMRGRVLVVLSGDTTTRLAYHEAGTRVMFSELQFRGPAEFEGDDTVYFFASDTYGVEDVAWAEEKRAAGGIVRLWKFNLPNVQPDPPVNLPATDRPDSDWYIGYCASVGCLAD